MDTRILFKNEAQKALFDGVKELHDAVACTLGPRGHSVIIDKGYGVPHVTKDGVTVARAYDTNDPMKRMGATLVKMVAAKTCDEAGDGTTTATILSYALMKRGMELMPDVKNPHRFRAGMTHACSLASDFIRRNAIKIQEKDIDRVKQIATISSNGDVEIGEMIAAAIENVGNDGVITVEESSKNDETTIEVTKGFQWEKGLVNPYFVTDPERIECVLDNPYILIWGQNINYPQEILGIVQTVYTMKRSLLIVAPNASNDILNFLVKNVQAPSGLKACFVKAPGYGQIQKDLMEDLAVKVGAKVVGSEFGREPEQAGTDWLGECNRVVVNSTKTVIIGGAGTDLEVSERVQSIKFQIEDTANTYDKEKFRERLSRLTGGAAIIYVGAESEVEMKERKDRVDDAIAATRAALEEGYVAGGGAIQHHTALFLISVLEEHDWDADFENGVKVVIDALIAHFDTLINNAGEDNERVVNLMFAEAKTVEDGYNPFENRVVNLISQGIIDPAKVTRVSLQNAVSVATQFLSTACAMAAEPEKK